MPSPARVPLLLAALALATAGRAHAEEAREPISVLGVEAVDLPEPVGARLTDALRGSLSHREKVHAMPGKDLVEMRLLFGCNDDASLGPCLAQVGRQLVVNRLIFGSIREVTVGGRKSGAYFVRLRILDVNGATVAPVEVHETVGPEALAAPRLEDTADRWIATLLDGAAPRVAPRTRPVAVTPSPAEAPSDERPGRRLLVGGIIAVALGVAAFGVSIATWRTYVDEEAVAHDALARLGAGQPDYYTQNRAFFQNPTCTPPSSPSLPDGATGPYLDACATGQSFASATTGLLVTGSVLGAVGVAGIVGGLRLERRDPGPRRALGPSLSGGPGGLALSW